MIKDVLESHGRAGIEKYPNKATMNAIMSHARARKMGIARIRVYLAVLSVASAMRRRYIVSRFSSVFIGLVLR
jgi:hypothetical protein